MDEVNSNLFIAIGRMEAGLQGLREQATNHHASLIQRMDDLNNAVHKRVDGLEDRVEVLEADNKGHFKTAASGAIGGALINGAIEVIKALAK